MEPVELLSLMNLETSLDSLCTRQHIFLEFIVQVVTFFSIGGFFAIVDFGFWRPKCLKKRQVVPPPLDEYWHIFLIALRNFAVNFLMTPLYVYMKDIAGYNTAPPETWFEIVLDFVRFVLPFHVSFYLWHRLVHIPPLYGWFHKKHHKYKAPIAFEGLYFTVVDLFMGNVFPVFFCTLYASRSQWTTLLINAVVLASVSISHCGYSIPMIESGIHDAHHEFFDINYGAAGVWMDKLLGTYRSAEEIDELHYARKRKWDNIKEKSF